MLCKTELLTLESFYSLHEEYKALTVVRIPRETVGPSCPVIITIIIGNKTDIPPVMCYSAKYGFLHSQSRQAELKMI
jgi:hypothetical protein